MFDGLKICILVFLTAGQAKGVAVETTTIPTTTPTTTPTTPTTTPSCSVTIPSSLSISGTLTEAAYSSYSYGELTALLLDASQGVGSMTLTQIGQLANVLEEADPSTQESGLLLALLQQVVLKTTCGSADTNFYLVDASGSTIFKAVFCQQCPSGQTMAADTTYCTTNSGSPFCNSKNFPSCATAEFQSCQPISTPATPQPTTTTNKPATTTTKPTTTTTKPTTTTTKPITTTTKPTTTTTKPTTTITKPTTTTTKPTTTTTKPTATTTTTPTTTSMTPTTTTMKTTKTTTTQSTVAPAYYYAV